MPPDMEAYAEDVRRRVEAANDPQKTHLAATPGLRHRFPSDVNDAEDAPEVMGAPRAGWRPGAIAAFAGAGGVLLAIALAVVLWAGQRDDAAAVEGGPPFASDLTAAEVNDAYLAMWQDGSIYAYIPDTDEGRRYFKAFSWAVWDYESLDIVRQQQKPGDYKELIELEQRFLAGEDLDVDIDITLSDGTRFVDDGSAPDPG